MSEFFRKTLKRISKSCRFDFFFICQLATNGHAEFQLSTCYPDRFRQIFDLFSRKFPSFLRKFLSELKKIANLNINF
jgi:hypothetical protein